MAQSRLYRGSLAQEGRRHLFTRLGTAVGLPGLFVMVVATVQGCDRTQTSSSSFDVLEARRFVLTGEGGRKLAVLETGTDGLPILALKDNKGQDRVRLAVHAKESPTLSLYGPNGRTTLSLTSVEGAPVLSVYDGEGKRRVAIATTEAGAPHLSLFDVNGRVRAVLGAASIESRTTEETEIRPVSSLVLFNKFGDVVFNAPAEGK